MPNRSAPPPRTAFADMHDPTLHSTRTIFPRPVWLLFGLYFVASFTHFVHNAEFIAFYPNLPQWLTRETVYLAWLAIGSVGLLAVAVGRAGFQAASAILLAIYGAFGLDGLGHYTLALCSEHTLATNLTVWFEVVSGLALMVAGSLLFKRRLVRSRRSHAGA